ncbi:MAG TPA: hypothetical protein VF103_01370 [Polyangiaceae bacterium]
MRTLWAASVGVWIVTTAACGGKSDGDDSGTGDGNGGAGTAGTSAGATGGTASGAVGTGGSRGVPEDWASVCARTADVSCRKWAECAPFLLNVAVPADCSAYFEASCRDFARLADIAVTPRDYGACLTAFERQACDDWLYNSTTPPECEGFVGTRALGSPCGSASQCASGVCSAGGDCGVCEAGAAEGESCLEESCAPGLRCGAYPVCTRSKRLGDPCNTEAPCNGPMVCRGGVCSKPPGNGEPCGTQELSCDFLQGLRCGESGLCEPWPIAGFAESCTGFCAAGLVCDDAGQCVRALAEGASCDALSNDACERGLECIDGACRRFDPTTCG